MGVVFPESRSLKEMKKNFDILRHMYQSRGFRIIMVHADEEFEKLRSHMLPSRFITPDPGAHVPKVERSIFTLKEGCRAVIHSLPYSKFPKEMICGLIRKVMLIQNAFPGDHGVSDTLSPCNIIDNLPNLDYHSIKIPFGTYAQVTIDEEVMNTQQPHTIGCIMLDPVGINQNFVLCPLRVGAEFLYIWSEYFWSQKK